MIAMMVFVIGTLSLLTVLTSSMGSTFDNRARITAVNLAAADIDEARAQDYYALGSRSYDVTVDGRVYTVTRDVTITLAAGGTANCAHSGSSSRALHKRVSTQVQTAVRGTTKPVRADTVVRAPIFDPNSPTGAISFLVLDRSSTPLSGLTVTVPGHSLTSNADGCVFFDGLSPGTYEVTVERAGSVTRTGNTTLAKAVEVMPGQISSASLRVDKAVTITVRSDVHDGDLVTTEYAAPTGLLAALAAPDRSMPTAVRYPDRAISPGVDVSWTAYPSPGGYDAFLGPCSPVAHTDSEPDTTPPKVPLRLYAIKLKVGLTNEAKLAGVAVNDRQVRVTWQSADGCSETLSYGVLTQGTKHDANAKISVPPGTWRFSLVDATGHTDATISPGPAADVFLTVTG